MNDPQIHKKWGLHKTNALDAWQLTTGSREIVVAIVDTGIDINHPDIKNNLWRNPGESGKDKFGRDKATNGIDDDNNGYIDDLHGWNFVHKNHNIKDNHGHGTHIAGIVGAEGGNKYGVMGVAPKVSLMVLKYFDPQSASNNLINTIKAFDYAVKMNAHIINYSGGGTEYSRDEFLAVKRAEQKGILFVEDDNLVYLIDKKNKVIVSTDDLGINIIKDGYSKDRITLVTLDKMERINVEQDSELARGFNLIDAICDILSQHINVQQDKSPNRKKKRGQQQN